MDITNMLTKNSQFIGFQRKNEECASGERNDKNVLIKITILLF